MTLTAIKDGLRLFGRNTAIKARKNAPEILLVTGCVGFVATVGLAIKQTLKADEIIEKHKEMLANIAEACEYDEEYASDTDKSCSSDSDLKLAYLKTGARFAKLYAPVMAVGALSLAAFLESHKIMKHRYLTAVAACNVVTELFKQYRKRVVDEVGEDMDRHYRFGTELHEEEVTTEDADGNTKTEKETTENVNRDNVGPSEDARFFDASNKHWDRNNDMNKMFLKSVESLANNRLQAQGSLFLNEVYDMLGFERTDRGALVGWLKTGEEGDHYVDIGFRDYQRNRKFVNGEENVVLLDFNHDGIIYDRL